MLRNYLKVALKVLLRRRFYTFISLFGIAFTLVVLTVAAAFLDHVFGDLPPETHADRTRGVYMIRTAGPTTGRTMTFPGYGFLDRYVRTLPGAERISLFTFQEKVVTYKDGARIEAYRKYTDGAFWQILDFRFLEGGPFTARDDQEKNRVAVLNASTRRRFFGDEPAAGRTVEIDGERFRVVGVVEDVSYLRITPFADVWLPIGTLRDEKYRTALHGNFMASILAPRASDLPRIAEEYRSALARFESPDPKDVSEVTGGIDTPFGMLSRMLFSQKLEESRSGQLLGWLLGLAFVFTLLPTVNLINVSVSRILERASEIGVRKAFGASSLTLVGQFLVENVVLTLVGGLLGFALAALVLGGINGSGLFPYARFALNPRVFLYGLLMTLFFGVLSGVYPAWRMSRLHPVDALKGALR
ncbi:MAG TPA: ABC transporter permease [Vicinamibacteria bacterium]|nr:ABC transporter permease [Vicinamibacteria bacterium]